MTGTRNEILYALNKPDNFVLALVSVPMEIENNAQGSSMVSDSKSPYLVEAADCLMRYLHKPFLREPDTNSCSMNYSWKELWQEGKEP
jgi:hypothetical protein